MSLRQTIFRAFRYLRYWLLGMDEHSLHSPSVYTLYTQRLKKKHTTKVIIPAVENLRQKLQKSPRQIGLKSTGAASSLTQPRLISRIATDGISSRRHSEILCHLMQATQATQALELGSSLGINTLYMSQVSSIAKVVTIEANEELAQLAQQHFNQIGSTHITLKNKDIDEALDELTAQKAHFDFIYIDANHTEAATLRYFTKIQALVSPNAIIALDDINWSAGMLRAWQNIKKNCGQLCIENHSLGIVILGSEAKPRNYVLTF